MSTAKMQSGKQVTVLDVAKHAGVSQGSVSRVLTGKNWVSDDVRARVGDAVKALGYVPNAMAQGLKARRTNTVAAIVSDMSNPLHAAFLVAAEKELRSGGYLLFTASTHNRLSDEMNLLSTFRAGRADGLIVALCDESHQESYVALRDTGLPVVFHDRESHGTGDAVLVDHRAGAHAATRHLLSLGHRRIAILTPPSVIRPGRERLAGYEQALSEAGVGMDPHLVRSLDATSDLAFSEVKSLLAAKQAPTAIITLGTRMLAGVLDAVASAGMEIPKDISIVGVGDTDLLRLHTPPITSVKWDIAQCGRLAAQLLLDRLGAVPGSAGAIPKERFVPVELVLRSSTAGRPKQRD
jgi:LacI family transcriptional regulator